MAKGVLLVVCLLCSIAFARGQDIITRTDGVILKAKVLEVQPTIIRYRKFGSADSLIFRISPSDVQSIQMEDGTMRTFSTPVTQSAGKKGKEPRDYETDFKRNVLSIYPLDFIYSNLTLSYERISSSGKVGIKIPVTIGLGEIRDYYAYAFRENTRFGAGLEVNIYPEGQGSLRYFLTPALNYRSFDVPYFEPNSGRFEPYEERASMITLGFKGGAFVQWGKFFQMSMDVGVGYRTFFADLPENEGYYNLESRLYLPGNLHLGFRF
ncbi:hypothetical protein [Rufibacter tibetensis]|uniref:Outer membrane protein beta-barrel domain-containing protein n=1 Tax=Rufibacter tibetensis TaxID=512763 RepID=A0A0P0CFF8_9BACT|nr:hypothetical protein [Rufibacter tibetensis]ALI97705.1 hypothetical protein DC20_00245 [Rufibacter tibetensis]